MKITRLVASVLAVLLAATSAWAQPSAEDVRKSFVEADQNGDGYVDREEYHLRLVEIYFFVDLDKDGFVEAEELDEVTVIKQDLSETDRNGDGRISLHEFVEARFGMYRAADADDDGRLGLDEAVAFLTAAQGSG